MNPAYSLSLADHLWQSTLFAGLAGLLALALRKNSARVRHGLWLAASCKFLIPFSVLIAVGSHVRWRTITEIGAPVFSLIADQVSLRFPVPSTSVPLLALPASSASPFPAILAGVWAFGFLGIACSWWVRWQRVRDAVRAASSLRLATPVPARSSLALLEPGVFGVFRPVLVLPDGILNHLSQAQVEAVVAHELCHIRHRDNLAAAIHMFVETVFWFHPLVWWIGKRMVDERERACDEEVVRLGHDPRVYAEGILNVCKLYVDSPLACVAGVAGSNLKRRVQAILSHQTARRLSAGRKAILAAAGTAALVLPVGIGMMNAPSIRAQSQAAAAPKFDVASVKPCRNEPGRMRGGGDSSPGRLSLGCDLLADDQNLGLIQRAYVRFAGGRPHRFGVIRIKGAPRWLHEQMYRIDATAEGHPSLEMMQGPMLQALLEDRFKLKIHRETMEGPVYSLTPLRSGARLKPFEEGSCLPIPLAFPLPAPPSGQRYCEDRISLGSPSIDAEGSTLAEFSTLLDLVLERKVIDRTGIPGSYNIHLEFSRDQATPGLLRGPVPEAPLPASDVSGPTIFTAIQEQLGLKLAPATGPVEYLVIDHVERPSEN